MYNQELFGYITQQLQQGVSREQVKNVLVSTGWQASDVDQCLAAVESGVLMAAPVPGGGAAIENPAVVYSGFWLRVSASIIDGFIFNLITGAFGFLLFWFFTKNNPSFSVVIGTVTGIFTFVTWIVYFPFMESRGGATFGKKNVGIKVTRVNGEPVRLLRSLGRNLAKIISVMILMIGFVMAAFTKKKQCLHDILAGCVVVRAKEINLWRIWMEIVLIVVLYVGILIFMVIKFFFLLSILFSGINNNAEIKTFGSTTLNNDNGSFTSEMSVVPVKIEFVSVSKEEYDTHFSKPISGMEDESDYKSAHIFAGPALIAFDDFWGLNIDLQTIPNMEDGRDYSWVVLESVSSREGKEILDKENSFEKDVFFQKLSFSKEDKPFEYLSAHRTIHLIKGAEPSHIKTIKGTLFFKIPIGKKDSTVFYEKSYPFELDI